MVMGENIIFEQIQILTLWVWFCYKFMLKFMLKVLVKSSRYKFLLKVMFVQRLFYLSVSLVSQSRCL